MTKFTTTSLLCGSRLIRLRQGHLIVCVTDCTGLRMSPFQRRWRVVLLPGSAMEACPDNHLPVAYENSWWSFEEDVWPIYFLGLNPSRCSRRREAPSPIPLPRRYRMAWPDIGGLSSI